MAFVLDEKLTTKWYDSLTVIPDDGDNVWFIVGDKIFVGVYCSESKRFYKADKSHIDLCEVRQWSPMNGDKQICKQPDNEQVVAANVRGVNGYVTGIFSEDLGQKNYGEKGPGLLLDKDYNIAELGIKNPISWEDVFDWYELPLEPILLLPVVSVSLIPLTIEELTNGRLNNTETIEQPKEEEKPIEPKPTSAIVASKNRNLMENNNEVKPMNNKLTETRVSYELTQYSFQPWGQAKEAWQYILDNGKFDALDSYLEEMYPEGIGETELNDILAYEPETVYEILGLKDPYAEDEDEEEDEEEEEEEEEQPIAEESYKGFDIYTWEGDLVTICKNDRYKTDADSVEDAKRKIDLKLVESESYYNTFKNSLKESIHKIKYTDNITGFAEPGDDIILFYKNKSLGFKSIDDGIVYLRQNAPEEAKEFFKDYKETAFKFNESVLKEYSKLNEDYGWSVKSGSEWDLFEELKESLGVSELLLALCKAIGNSELGETLAFICRNYDYNNPYLENYDEELEESKKLKEDYGWSVKSGSEWDLLDDMVSMFGEEDILNDIAKALGTYELGENLAFICRTYDFRSSYLENFDDDEEELDESISKNNKLTETGRLTSVVKNWYIKKYPTDELGSKLDDSITFNDLIRCMELGCNFYDLIGVGDSLVRERVFNELANRLHVDYGDIYNIWLYGAKLDKVKIKESKSDGWPEEVAEIFSDVFYDVERFKYEVDRCIRGSFTNVKDIKGLCEVARKIGEEWLNIAENDLPYVNDPDIYDEDEEDEEDLEEKKIKESSSCKEKSNKENDFSYLPESIANQVSDFLKTIKL